MRIARTFSALCSSSLCLALLILACFPSGLYAAALSPCATTGDSAPTAADVQLEINEALGTAAAVHDFNNDNVVNLVDIQIVIDGVLNLGCSATPVITDFNPKTGTIGTLVTVTGRYLAATQISMPQAGGGMATQQPVTISATGVSFAVPITAATGPITISTLSSSATTTASFTVIPIPSGQTVIAGRAVNGGGGPIAGAIATTQDGLSATTASDGTFLIPGESASVSTVVVTVKATVGGVAIAGLASVAPVGATVTNVGDITLLACAPAPTGLVSWWTGDGHLEDIVSGNNGTVQVDNPSYATGLYGQAFSFDGATQFFSVPDSASLDGITTAISVAGWVNPQTTTLTGVLLSRRTLNSTETFTVYLNYPSNGAIMVRVSDTVHGTQDFPSSSGVLQAGQWQHVVATANTATGKVKLYVNGLPVSLTNAATLSGQFLAATNLFIGATEPGTYIFKGLLEEVQLYGVEITQAQIQAMISAPSGTCSAPFTTTATGRVVDQNGSGVAGAAVNTLGPTGTVRSATTASDGSFSISGVIAVSPITASASATVDNVPLFATSASVTPVQGGTTMLGNIVLAACAPPVTGLVSWWTGDGYFDDIVSGNNGAVQNTNPTFAAGKVGQAFSFNGANQYFSVPDSASLDGITSAITIAGWIEPLSTNGIESIFSRHTASNVEVVTIYLNYPSAGKIDVRVSDTVHGAQDFSSAAGVIQFGQWQYIAVTANTSTGLVKLYLNGQQVGLTNPVTLSGQLPAGSSLFVGAEAATSYNYNGLIDELQLYSVELTQDEIQTIMTAPAGTCSAPFTTVLTGRVVDPGGNGVAGVVVTTFGPAGSVASATTASDGTFSISGVLAVMGPVSVGVSATVNSVPLFGASQAVAPVPGGTAALGNVMLEPCVSPAPGLVSWWTGDGTLDDIVSGNNGTVQATNPTFVAGEVGQAFSFNGSTQFFAVPGSASLDGITSAITFTGWINPQSTTSTEGLLSLRASGTEVLTIYLNYPNSGTITVRVTDSVHGTQDFYSSTGVFQFGQWQQIAATANTSTGLVKLYLNGQQVGLTIPVALSGHLTAANSLYIGVAAPNTYAYNGLIDELQLYNVELTQSQIQDIYLAPNAGVCRTGFETTVTGQVQDATMNPVTGARAAASGGPFSLTASDGTFSIPNVLTILSPIRVDAAAVIAGTPVFGSSANVPAVAAGATNVGTISLSQCSPGGLVSLWPGEGNANDIVGGNNGTFEGAAAYAPGLAGQAFSFNGSTGYISVPDSGSLDAITSTISAAGWVNPQSTTGIEGIFSRNSGGTTVFTIYFNQFGAGSVTVTVTDSSHGTQNFYSLPGTIQFGQWQYLVATANTGTGLVKLYLNGQLVDLNAPVVLSGQLTAGNSLFIGAAQADGYLFLGLIDELQLYNVELSQGEIQNIYAQGGTGMCRQ